MEQSRWHVGRGTITSKMEQGGPCHPFIASVATMTVVDLIVSKWLMNGSAADTPVPSKKKSKSASIHAWK